MSNNYSAYYFSQKFIGMISFLFWKQYVYHVAKMTNRISGGN